MTMATGVSRWCSLRAQPAQEPETVDQRHPQVEDDRVGAIGFSLAEAGFGRLCRSDLVALEPQHPGEGVVTPSSSSTMRIVAASESDIPMSDVIVSDRMSSNGRQVRVNP